MSTVAVTGSFEIHVFVAPFDPAPDVATAFTSACRGTGDAPRMKGLLLRLDYEGRGFVGVLQSSRYVRGTVEDALAGAEEDAAILASAGFDVIRKKIEAVSTNLGVPRTDADVAAAPAGRYFEFHLLIDRRSGPISNDDVASLRAIATRMSARLGRPVPLSYNALKPAQRFLNLRTHGAGLDASLAHVRHLEAEVAQTGELGVIKVIAEYVCADDNRAIDDGWLEPLG